MTGLSTDENKTADRLARAIIRRRRLIKLARQKITEIDAQELAERSALRGTKGKIMSSEKTSMSAPVHAVVMPCPFCGAAGEDVEVLLDHLECRVCSAQGPYSSYSDDGEKEEPANAIELWNDRREVAALEARIEELEREVEHRGQIAWNRLSDAEKDAAIRMG